MGNRKVQKHGELDVYHSHKHVRLVLRDSENILSTNKNNFLENEWSIFFIRHTETVAATSAPTPPVIGAS